MPGDMTSGVGCVFTVYIVVILAVGVFFGWWIFG